jgi:hypothetical protein
MQKRKLKVFLSHSPNDEAAARELYDRLNDEGWMDVWLAEDKLLAGYDWNLETEKAVDAAELAIVCISKSSTTQQGLVQKELRLIWDAAQNMPQGTIFIIPLKLEECEPPYLLHSLRFADYFEKDREKGYQRLLVSLRMRASGLGIVTTKPAPDRPKTPGHANAAPVTQDAQLSSVDIGGNAQGNMVIEGSNNKVTQNITIYGKPENAEDRSGPSQVKSRISTDKITFTPREDTTAIRQDGTGHYACIEIFNREDHDLRECYVTLNALYVSDGQGWLNMLQHINPNISHLTWPVFRPDQEKIIRRNKSARINIAKTIAGNISFPLEDGDHPGVGSHMRNDYYIEIELNGSLNLIPIEGLIFKGFLHDKSEVESIPDRLPQFFRRLYIEAGELDGTLRDN